MAAPVGNQNAKKGRLWQDAIKRAIARKHNGDLNHGLDTLAEKLVDAVANGDLQAIKELGDRIDGKPAQAITGADGGPLETRNVTEIVTRGVVPDAGLPGQGT
jgi:molecular chaperone GrpE (heat shock protein)